MDLWVVAAAAGAGYLAKYWQNVKESEGLSEPSARNSGSNKPKFTPLTKHLDQKRVELGRFDSSDRSCPFRRWVRRKSEKQTSSTIEEDAIFSDSTSLDILGSPTNETVSTGGVVREISMNLRKDEEGNVLPLSSLQPQVTINEDHQEDGNRTNGIGDLSYTSGCGTSDQANLLQSVGMGYGFGRGRSFLNSKCSHRYSVKPLSSLESCAITQLCKECVEMEEHAFSSFQSQCTPNVTPLFITDDQIIRNSNSSKNSLSLQFENMECKSKIENEVDLRVKDTMIGFPPIFEAGLVELPKKLKRRRGKARRQRSDISNTHCSGKHFHSQGSPDGVLLFCLGIGMGKMFTVLSNKKEVEKLNELLKQTQNLVRDLHEELEMKDSLTVKVLANEDCRFRELNESSDSIKEAISSLPYEAQTAFPPNEEADVATECYDDESHIQEEGEKSESLSKIEAELAAELARLELNIKASSLERRMSDFGELDPNLVGDIVHGELKANMINGGVDSDQDACGSSTTHAYPTNYAVSPRELGLRLHELIQSRLEERITELESALQDSQKQLRLMEAEQENSQRGFSSSDFGSFSTHESPTTMEHTNAMSTPLFLNLSDNSLNAHNEAYIEFMNIAENREANKGKQTNDEGPHPLDQIPYRGQVSTDENGSSLNLEIENMDLHEAGESEDYDDDDELGKLLIKHIVEKTRQGSPVVLNAQRLLFSMDE